MRVGMMNSLVTFERRSTEQDNAGQQKDEWSVIGKRMASIEPLRGVEYFSRSGEHSDVSVRIRLRYDEQLNPLPDDRITFGTRRFNIGDVINTDTRNREMVLMCRELISTHG